MTGKEAYVAMLRDQVGPALRRHGFKGSGRSWILTAANGDRAIVNAQSSDMSTQARVVFTFNLAVIPLPWWIHTQEAYGRSPSRAPKEYHGVWRDRMNARRGVSDRDDWWAVTDDESARECAGDIVEQFDDVITRLAALLDRETMKQSLRSLDTGFLKGPNGQQYCDRALAILLADEGPSSELDILIAKLDPKADAGFVTWLRTRASGSTEA